MLFNAWKHHAGALRHGIAEYVRRGADALPGLAEETRIIGTRLMDLYVGRYSPAEISRLILVRLDEGARLAPDAYCAWVESGGGYRMLPLPDGSEWVLRLGEEGGRYVHVHPGRWVPQTKRVRANVLKTAVMALAYAGVHGSNPLELSLINRVRAEYLGLAPLGRLLTGDQGIGEVIDLLRP